MEALNLQFEFILLLFETLLCFLSEIQPNYQETCETFKIYLYVSTYEIYKVDIHLKILIIS
jgi:hypothetical protein